MSYRQFGILLAWLAGVLWSTAVAQAQLSVQHPPRSQRSEPAPLRQGGFIQQLRAIPSAPTQPLQEVDERAFRLPARSDSQPRSPEITARPPAAGIAGSGVAARQLPPTYNELQNRSALSRRLRGEHAVPAGAAMNDPSSVGLSLSDRSQVVDAEAQGNYQASDPYIVAASNQSQPKSSASDAKSRQSAYELAGPAHSSELPRNEAFDALTAESLRQAPRVSRVPLPRPAAAASGNLPSTDSAPERIVATPASVTPHLGGIRANNATLRSAVSDDRAIPEVSPEAASRTPTPALQQDSLVERPATLELPPLPGGDTPRGPDVSASDVSAGGSAHGQSLHSQSPALPGFASRRSDSRDEDRSESRDASSQPADSLPELSMPAMDMPAMDMPSFGAVEPQSAPPKTQQPTQPTQRTSRAADSAGLSGSPAHLRTSTAGAPDQRLKMDAPRLSVVLTGPGDLPIGSPADYRIVVQNQDSLDLNGLILRLDIPAGVSVQAHKPTHGAFELEKAADGLTMLTWSFEHLSAGQTATAPMQLVASSAKNFAVAMEWTLMPMAGSSAIAVRAPQLELALEGPAEVRFGEPNVYRLRIRNPGNAAAEQIAVRLSAERFGSSAAEIKHIAPGEEEVIDVELTFNEQGSISIDAVAQEQTGLTSQTAIAVVVRQAVVEAELLTAPLVYHSAPTECRVRLTNTGDADARGMQAVLQLPEGAGLVSTPTGAVLKDRELTWPVDKLIAGSTEEFVVQLKLTTPGANSLSLLCSGPGNVTSAAQAVTRVEAITDLKLFVEAPIAPAPVGGEVAYELTLTNRGSKAATNVIVVAQFSDGIEPIRGEGQAARVVPGQALFETLPSLAAGETIHLKVIAQAAAAGSHRFRVEVRSDDSQVRLVQEESTQYLESASRLAAPPKRGSSLR